MPARAVKSPTRLPELEDVPTVAESGYPDFAIEAGCGVVAPVIAWLNAEVRKALDPQ